MNLPSRKAVSLLAIIVGTGIVLAWLYRGPINVLISAYPTLVAILIGLLGLVASILVLFPNRREEWWRESGDIVLTSFFTLVAIAGGLYLVCGIGGYSEPKWQDHVIRGAIGWALAYFASGFFAGFLFGIPRVLQGEDVSGDSKQKTNDSYRQKVNTNLEQISDWLTKIIVGLGLVELRAVPRHLYNAARWMATSLGLKPGDDTIASFSCAFIIYFSIVGFLAGYLITRLFLAGAFWRADRGLVVKTPPADYVANDNPAARIYAYWKPNGQVDRARQSVLMQWLQAQSISAMLPVFLNGVEYTAERAKMVADLKIPQIPHE